MIKVTVLVLAIAFTTQTHAADSRCQYLENLARQYSGVTLTAYQQSVKRQLMSWYRSNCRK